MYGAIVIEHIDLDPVAYDRDYVVQFSDWTDEAPANVYATLKNLAITTILMSEEWKFMERH